MPELVRVSCRIMRSPFEPERVFILTRPDGEDHSGFASADYCHQPDGTPWLKDEPEAEAPGLVDARLAGVEGGTAWVYVPNGETIPVSAEMVRPGVLTR